MDDLSVRIERRKAITQYDSFPTAVIRRLLFKAGKMIKKRPRVKVGVAPLSKFLAENDKKTVALTRSLDILEQQLTVLNEKTGSYHPSVAELENRLQIESCVGLIKESLRLDFIEKKRFVRNDDIIGNN